MKKVRHFCILAFTRKEFKKRGSTFSPKNVPDSFVDEIIEKIQNRYSNLEILPRKGSQDDYDIREGIE